MRLNHLRTLILNADYMPLSVQSWQKCMVLVFKDVVNVVEYYKLDSARDTKGNEYQIPAVVVLRKYVRQNIKDIPFSKKNVFMRDKMTCQYCGTKFHPKELTFDHIIPRAKWKRQDHGGRSPTTWENIATSCFPCNQKKNNKTPTEAKMPLKFGMPKKPRHGEIIIGLSPWRDDIPTEWEPYLQSIYQKVGA